MAKRRALRGILVATVLVVAACAGAEDVDSPGATSATTTVATSTTIGSATTNVPDAIEPGEVPVSETLDPAGGVEGGTVGRSYLGDDYPPELAGIVGLAVADLTNRISVAESDIAVVLVEEVVWSDASHGCPQPGMSYAQVLTDGMRIVLESKGLLYDYRSGGLSDPELCEQAVDKDETRAGMFELTEDGEIVFVPIPGTGKGPTETIGPPDE